MTNQPTDERTGVQDTVACSAARSDIVAHLPRDYIPNPLCRLDRVPVGEMGVTRCRAMAPASEQLANQGHVLARHDGLTGGG